ncbi:MAG: lipocalin family protein [Bacteroidota bacterium]|jgi:hypothetical protein|nr:lipocalin family protein [Sphingobacteriales bacterium]
MKLKSMRLLTFLLSTSLLISCSKDEESKSATDLLTGGSSKSWRVESLTINGDPIPSDSCDADDFTTFIKSGNTYTDNPGNITCGDSASSGTWALSNGDKVLTLNRNTESNVFDVNELSEHKLVLKTSVTDTSMGVPTVFNIIATFAHLK